MMPGAVHRFDAPQAMVEFFVRIPAGEPSSTFQACRIRVMRGRGAGVSGTADGRRSCSPTPRRGDDRVRHRPRELEHHSLDVDDVSFSPVRQPGTEVVRAGARRGGSARDLHVLVQRRGAGVVLLRLDGAPSSACTSPFTLTGLALGEHTLVVTAVDAYGRADPTPRTSTFTVVAAPPPSPTPTRDGVPDASDNCPAAANSDQADADADGVGNACEQLPPGNVPPVAGSPPSSSSSRARCS